MSQERADPMAMLKREAEHIGRITGDMRAVRGLDLHEAPVIQETVGADFAATLEGGARHLGTRENGLLIDPWSKPLSVHV